MFQDLILWLSQTHLSVALRESIYVYPCLQTLHVISLIPFAGIVFLFDLRLMGLTFPDVLISEIMSRCLPLAIAAFIVIVVTGALLFYANPDHMFHSLWLRIKILLILVSMANIVVFRRRGVVASWDSIRSPWRMRVAGALSLLLWIAVIFSGRMIAYEWFDCEKSPPHWVQWFAQCGNHEL